MKRQSPFWLSHDRDRAKEISEPQEPTLEEMERMLKTGEAVVLSTDCIDHEWLAEGGNGYE
jgi:hypothetical protein